MLPALETAQGMPDSLRVSTSGSGSALKECGPPIPVQIVALGKGRAVAGQGKRKPGSLGPGVLGT